MSLVADYSDSDNSNTSDDETTLGGKTKDEGELSKDENQSKNTNIDSPNLEGASANLLLPSASDSSDSDNEDNDSNRKPQMKATLDNPFRTFGDVNIAKEDSVFRNPFRDKEDEKIAVLEHHVKMTENPQYSLSINGKKICWNYRKRKCYLGTKCPYAHDSDVPLTEEQLKEQKLENDLNRANAGAINTNVNVGQGSTNSKTHLPGTASVVAGGYDSSAFFSSPHLGGSNKKPKHDDLTEDCAQEHSYNNKSNKKKRVGLSNSLTPPKKAMMLYHKTKDK